ncbi:hypothetical protein D3C78_1225150 [compost metagenome]
MQIVGPSAYISEIATDLEQAGISRPPIKKGLVGVDILSIALGATIPIIGHVLVEYLRRNNGQRTITVDIDREGEHLHIEVSSPKKSEIIELLKDAKRITIHGDKKG